VLSLMQGGRKRYTLYTPINARNILQWYRPFFGPKMTLPISSHEQKADMFIANN